MSQVFFASGGGRPAGRFRRALWLSTALVAPAAALILASHGALAATLPTGGQYVAGSGTIAGAGSSLTVTQSTSRGVIDWQGFSIGAGDKVQFDNGSGATLNRVTGGSLSTIAGELSATGTVYLINPNGVVVNSSGKVVTGGGFVASTRDVSNSQFMAGGPLDVSGTSAGGVVNEGRIVSADGDVVLIGAAVSNTGTITAKNGTAALAAGNQVVLSEASGPAGIYVAPDVNAVGNASNAGRIKAAAVELAAAGGNVYALAGNHSGVIQATGTATVDGQVWLTAPHGAVDVAGTVEAKNATGAGGTVLVGVTGPNAENEAASTAIETGAVIKTGAGGHIETSGKTLSIGKATVDAGAGGLWLLDPTDLTIDAAAAGTIEASLATPGASVVESATDDVTVASGITWSTNASLTLTAGNDLIIDAPITVANGGALVLDGTVEIAMGQGSVQFTGSSGGIPLGSLTINGTGYTLVSSLATLAADVTSSPSGDYALATDINASDVTGFTPIGEGGFTGTFDGLGNTISNLTINDSTDLVVGLFGTVGPGGIVRNIGLINAAVTGDSSVVGGLVGLNEGTVTNAFATGMVTGDADIVGGLVGTNAGTIEDSYAAATVTGSGGADTVGGLVGQNAGQISDAYATGVVTGSAEVGGLAGENDTGATIIDAYATGAVNGAASDAGGLLGRNNGGTIIDAYATGSLSGSTGVVGGLVGFTLGGTITDGYWDETTTGTTTGVGTGAFTGAVVGLTTLQWLTEGPTVAGSPNGFMNGGAWVAGSPYPVLGALPFIIVTATGTETFGSNDPVYTIVSELDQNGDNESGLVTGTPSFFSIAPPGSPIGSSFVAGGSGLSAAGFQVAFDATLTVTAVPPPPPPPSVTPASPSVSSILPALPQQPAVDGQDTLLLSDTNALAPVPVIIDASEAADTTTGSDDTAISTGLPLPGSAEQTALGNADGRHLTIRLPPPLTGFTGQF
jgi:filamentous hemagglutinin family protein